MIKSNLSVLMAQRGLNISKLSRDTGISRNTISSLYNNEAKGVQFETLNKLCDYFTVDVNEIIYKLYAHIHLGKIEVTNKNNFKVSISVEIQDKSVEGNIEIENNDIQPDIIISNNIFNHLSVIPSMYQTSFLEKEMIIPVMNKLKLSPKGYSIKVINPDYITNPLEETRYLMMSLRPNSLK